MFLAQSKNGYSGSGSLVATSAFARGGTAAVRILPTAASVLPRTAFGAYEIELRGALDLDAVAEAWTALARRAIAENPFCEHALLAAAARHLPEGRRLTAILVWKRERLVGVVPATSGRGGFGPRRLAPWRTDLLPSAAPLIDREEAEGVLDALLAFAAARDATLSVADVVPGSALADLLAARRLRPGGIVEAPTPASVAPDAPRGDLAISTSRGAREIRDAVELFLALDADAAAAAHTIALVQDPGRANVVRTATRRAARERTCRVAIARRGERVVAAAIVLRNIVWLTAEAPDAAGGLAILLAKIKASTAAPARSDWTLASPEASAMSLRRPGAALVATARRLFSPLARLDRVGPRPLTPPDAGAA